MNLRRMQGAALIMVLMIVALMSVVMLGAVNKNHLLVKEASLLKRSEAAYLKLKNTKAELIQLLTTTPLWLLGPTPQQLKELKLNLDFNFYGYPFDYQGVELSIQDINGLISLYPYNEGGMRALLEHVGVEQERIGVISDSIADWIDKDNFVRLSGAERSYYSSFDLPRNAPFQSMDELLMVRGMTFDIFQKVKPFIALMGSEALSKQYLSDELMVAIHSEIDAAQVIAARENERRSGDSSSNELYDGEFYYPGQKLAITMVLSVDGKPYQESFTLVRTRGVVEPFVVVNRVIGVYEE